MKLVIVESPTKEKTISKYLGKGYRTMASLGHIRDLSKEGEENLGIDIDHDFEPHYTTMPSKMKTVARLEKAAADCEEVYLATDPDREGEAISWHIAQVLNLDLSKTKRLEFHEITPYGIKNAVENPRLINLNLVSSQETRRILDRIIGFKLSGLLRNKINSQSAGRVQSAVLKLIVDRENEINKFVSEEYFLLYIDIKDGESNYQALLKRLDDQEVKITTLSQAEQILNSISDKVFVKSVEVVEKDYYARPPFTTSSLQQEAFSKLKFSTKKTMEIAQSLYEGIDLKDHQQGVITYMRTDSIRINPQFINQAKKQIENMYGSDYVGKAFSQKDNSQTQDAHEAIRPTNVELTPEDIKEYLSPDQYKLYELIYARALASMMKPRRMQETNVVLSDQNKEFEFSGSSILFDGYSKLYKKYEKLPEKSDVNIKEGSTIEVVKKEIVKKETLPPYRFNEGSIVKTMEELGIGRPSTYVATIDTLKKRDYIKIVKNVIHPTDQGKLTVENLAIYFHNLVDAKYTAMMEKQLDEIENGSSNKLDILHNFYHDFAEQLGYAKSNMEKIAPVLINENCPQCGKPLVQRKGKFGEFVGCSGYPSCTYIRSEAKEIPANAKTCPKCKQGKLVLRKGKYGGFLGCNRYPDCDYMEKFKNFKKT